MVLPGDLTLLQVLRSRLTRRRSSLPYSKWLTSQHQRQQWTSRSLLRRMVLQSIPPRKRNRLNLVSQDGVLIFGLGSFLRHYLRFTHHLKPAPQKRRQIRPLLQKQSKSLPIPTPYTQTILQLIRNRSVSLRSVQSTQRKHNPSLGLRVRLYTITIRARLHWAPRALRLQVG